jgi:hypothetical protein
MRKAFNDYGFLVDDDIFIGISLGYDYCAEHEWGIKGIKSTFGIPEETTRKNMGIKSRTITICPENLLFEKDGKDGAVLWTGWQSYFDKKVKTELPRDLKDYKKRIKSDMKWEAEAKKRYEAKGETYRRDEKDPMISAWSERDFGVAVYGEEKVAWLEYLYEQFKKKNVAITRLNISGDNPFANASLSLVIVDRLPDYALDALYNGDKKYLDLEDYEKKIGMVKIKEKARENSHKRNKDSHMGSYKQLHYYMACSPDWINYEDEEAREARKKELGTKYDIQYWINYADDDDIAGWYTVEVIKKWLTGNKKLSEVAEVEASETGRLYPKK